MKRIVDLYSIYGSENTALVNPKGLPGRIEVRDRQYAEYRLNQQKLEQSMRNLQAQSSDLAYTNNDDVNGPYGAN